MSEHGSAGERELQCAWGTEQRAERFRQEQVLDHLNPAMIEFVGRMELAFIATADATGQCDASLRAGSPGFLRVLTPRILAYPEYRGNGMFASLGNIRENPHIGMALFDFTRDRIGLHINGGAVIEDRAVFEATWPLPAPESSGRTPERWVVVSVLEAYIHCRKHLPLMVSQEIDRAWGTDDVKRKGGDYFGVKADRRETGWRERLMAGLRGRHG